MLIRRLDSCEEIIANDGCRLRELLHPDKDGSGSYSLAIAWVDPGERTHAHRLEGRREVYLILEGGGEMHIDDDCDQVAPGDAVVIPAGATQWIENTGAAVLKFAAIVDPPWTAESDRLATC
ncbi:MAG: cupin domain-containing protein [Planctomycetota bacterium]|jgi:mannose-6-phosphate isomerase-like protein (cupin superfamily)